MAAGDEGAEGGASGTSLAAAAHRTRRREAAVAAHQWIRQVDGDQVRYADL